MTATRGTLTITHTRAEGTTLDGSRKGDGVFEIVRQHGFWFSRQIGLYIRQSRDKAAMTWKINAAAEALRAAGWTVEIEICEDERRTFAEAEAERVDRAAERADRFAGYADNAAARSDAYRETDRRIGERFAMGQPILIGHHSEGRARRDQERMHTAMRNAITEQDKASHYAGRAASAEHYEQHRNDPGRTLRRIAKLQADLRRVEKWLAGRSAGGFCRDITNPDTVAELNRRKDELNEEIAYWQDVIAKAEANGFKVWSKADFTKGDFALYGGTWYEVLRVNAKSVTIPHIHNGIGRKVVRKGDGHLDWTWTVTYDGVKGRKSAAEMTPAAAEPQP